MSRTHQLSICHQSAQLIGGLKGHFPYDPSFTLHMRWPLATFTLMWVRVSNKKETMNAF
jgi:hypothetical protein